MRDSSTIWAAILALLTVSCKGEKPAQPLATRAPASMTASQRAAEVARGAALFGEHCTPCHGEDRRGHGRARAKLTLEPRDLSNPLFLVTKSDDALVRTMLGGGASVGRSKEMPKFSDELSEQDAEDVVTYLRASAVSLEACFPQATHYVEVGPAGGDALLAAYASAVPAGGRPVVLEKVEEVPLDARKLGYVMLTELVVPNRGPTPAAVVGGTDGQPLRLSLALPPGERERAEAQLSKQLLERAAPVLKAVAEGRPPPRLGE